MSKRLPDDAAKAGVRIVLSALPGAEEAKMAASLMPEKSFNYYKCCSVAQTEDENDDEDDWESGDRAD